MAAEFEFNMSRFLHAIEGAADTIAAGAKRGMHDALDDWKREAVDVAPIDKGTLRRSISVQEIEGAGANLTGGISANAVERTKGGRRFNYAYYIHEVKGDEFSGKTPGTVGRFLDVPAEKNGEKWMRGIEAEIADELKRKGW
ncbi:HK97 gp10 family phage protein [Paenibacillus humicus]|uniref:HK97 gp10 family phage protein n=1 Tax=Paenibacillus humicus TaxID=412861 RepID=UPI000FD80107|nr:HK97 gp10 family phage protein [Paenibacillus humicus]